MSDSTKGYVAPPSTGHEIGVMFGFIGAMLLAMVLYAVWFNIWNKRSLAREEERMRAVRPQYGTSMDDEKKG